MLSFLKKLGRTDRAIMYTCYFAFFCSGSCTLMLGSAMPDLKLAYSLSDTLGGLLLSGQSAGNLVAGFISGIVPLYLGRRRSVVLLSALMFLGVLMMVLWGNPIWLLLSFVLVGLGRGACTNFSSYETNMLADGSSTATNLLHASFAVGALTAPMVFLLLRGLLGWKAGLVYVVLIGCVSLTNLSRMQVQDDHPDRRDKSQSTLCFLKNPSYMILALMMFCYLCSEYAINGWLVTYLQNKENFVASFGMTGETLEAAILSYSQSMATLLWAVMLVGRLFCAWLFGKVPIKTTMLAASVGVAVFFALMLLSDSVGMVTFAIAGLGFSMAGICPMIYSDACVFTNTYPMATSMLLAIGSTGAIAMPAIVGALADAFGFSGGMSAILVAIVLLVACSLLNVVVKTRLPKASQTAAPQERLSPQ